MNTQQKSSTDELNEGALYVCKKGELIELPGKEEDDDALRIRLVKPVAEILYAIQKSCRKKLNGYKPDVSQVTAALVVAIGQDVEAASNIVIEHCRNIYSTALTKKGE